MPGLLVVLALQVGLLEPLVHEIALGGDVGVGLADPFLCRSAQLALRLLVPPVPRAHSARDWRLPLDEEGRLAALEVRRPLAGAELGALELDSGAAHSPVD